MKKHLLSAMLMCFLILSSGCMKLPQNSELSSTKIVVGSGPEDMVLDTLQGNSRLLISCASRREGQAEFGEIVSYDLGSGKIDTLERRGEPDGIVFRPHGVYLEGDKLYIISHEQEPDVHIVLVYIVKDNLLIFSDIVRSQLLNSPNALVTGPSGEIYVVNDSGKRGSLAEKIFRLKKASVVRFDKIGGDGNWKGRLVAGQLGYPAGINRIGNKIYAGDAVLHKIHVYKISDDGLSPQSEIADIKGNDNIKIHEGNLLTPGHVKPFKFVGHAKDAEKKSPVEVFLVDPESGSHKMLFFDDGNRISGGSTAIIFENKLYICQVFEPYILKVDLN